MKKAFTLTELLIVVLTIGVLAAVATPKMKHVLETRKTTEAESMLSSVRVEQEKRCSIGKKYHTNPAELSVLASAAKGKNYTYQLSDSGIAANSASHQYSIEMLSYKEGALCCRGEYCEQLNKDYPRCETITISSKDECASEETPSDTYECDENLLDVSRSCPEGNGTQTRTATCDTQTGQWIYGEWTGPCLPFCGPKLETEKECSWGVGKLTRTATCDTQTGQWIYGVWEGTCEPDETKECDESSKPSTTGSCGWCGKQEYEVECVAGSWKATPVGDCVEPDTAQCKAGSTSSSGGPTCRVKVFDHEEMTDADSKMQETEDEVLGSNFGDSDGLSNKYQSGNNSTEPTYHWENKDAGMICNTSCRWMPLTCPSYNSGGGGSGGRPIGCSGPSHQYYTRVNTNKEMTTEHCTRVVDCDGSVLGDSCTSF